MALGTWHMIHPPSAILIFFSHIHGPDNMDVKPRKEVAELPEAVHGGQAWKLTCVEDYSQNLNPLGPPEGLADEIAKAYGCLGHYPDVECTRAREAIAAYYGLGKENVVMGAGSSEIIRNFPMTFLEPGDRVLMFSPTFAEYARQCGIMGVRADVVELLPSNDFRIDRNALTDALDTRQHKALWLCNPNNPTGRMEKRADLLDIVRECEEIGTMVFLDETLLSLCKDAESTSLIPFVDDFSNLVIAKSFTKSFAIPGLRIGYALTNPAIAREMQKVSLPWNLGAIEQHAAAYLISLRANYVSEAAITLRKESEIMQSQLDSVMFPVGPVSDSFFYFVPVSQFGITGEDMQRQMLKNGIMVRDCASFGPQFKDYVRYCVKGREQNATFLAAAEKVMTALGH